VSRSRCEYLASGNIAAESAGDRAKIEGDQSASLPLSRDLRPQDFSVEIAGLPSSSCDCEATALSSARCLLKFAFKSRLSQAVGIFFRSTQPVIA
jgi:hypothetical protein